MPTPSAILAHHQDNNRATATGWTPFAAHREKVTALVQAAAPEGATLLVLGAGNCNDLDLEALAARCSAIHLVDLDPEALARGRARQPDEVQKKLVLHTPVDFSGAYDRLPGLRGKSLTPAALSEFGKTALERTLAAINGRFDVVLSACSLSQIMHSCFLALGKHAALNDVAEVLARVHVRALLSLTQPGGQALLVTDTVSSETYPLEELWGTRDPLALLQELERSENFLSGTAPSFVRRLFTTDEVAAPLLAGPPRLVPPWLWRLGDDLAFLVYAFAARRHP